VTAKPYDPTLKALVETEPESWPVFLGRPRAPTEVIDADIATVSGAADKVLRVSAPCRGCVTRRNWLRNCIEEWCP
jgi:hypothetical protein